MHLNIRHMDHRTRFSGRTELVQHVSGASKSENGGMQRIVGASNCGIGQTAPYV